jgi:hypothetical protein
VQEGVDPVSPHPFMILRDRMGFLEPVKIKIKGGFQKKIGFLIKSRVLKH